VGGRRSLPMSLLPTTMNSDSVVVSTKRKISLEYTSAIVALTNLTRLWLNY